MSKQTFVANTILTAAQMNTLQANDYNQTVATKTASYTLVASDAGTRVVMNVASANTVTVNTSLFTAGDTLVIQNIGAGVTTVTAGTATVSSAGPLTISQYGSGTLYFTSAGVSLWFPSAVTVAAPAASGLTLISTTSFSGVTNVTVSNAFSATYKNYKIFLNNCLSVSSTPAINLTFGSATSNYEYSLATSSNTTFDNFNRGASSGNKIQFTDIDTTIPTQATLEFLAPFLTQKTLVISFSSGYQNNLFYSGYGAQTDSTSFTSFKFAEVNGNNFSGTIEVYGYAI